MDYAATCSEWGLDPGADIEDDFLAWQMRYGLAVRLWEARTPKEPEKDPGDEVRDRVAESKAAADAFEQEMMGAL